MSSHRDIDLIYQNTSQVEAPDLEAGQKALKGYIDFIWRVVQNGKYDQPESLVNLPADVNFRNSLLQKVQDRKNSELKQIIVVGIGGSNLGTMALYRALRGRLGAFLLLLGL